MNLPTAGHAAWVNLPRQRLDIPAQGIQGVQALAKMPGLKELRAKLLSIINQPAGMLVRTIAAPGSQLARVFKAREEKLGKQA